ncbi:Type I restriction-modification system, specificity subunit S [uncultured Gammaproteobacteria bacterium]|nr:Type I restriction-modification system, specificity subunit S [uncultured Gammaproteobacteria bacterium]
MKMDKNLHIPQGYRQTEVGVIPDDWEVVRLGKIGNFIGGGTPSTKIKEYWNGSIPWVSSSDLTEENIYQIHKHRFITDSAIGKSATKKVPKNSVLIVSRVGVGKVAINKDIICTSQDFQSLIPGNNNCIFLAYLIKDKAKLLASYNQGTSIKGFVSSDLKNLQIPLPPKQEQQKIADILTTWDNAINQQTTLIEKKQQLKKGLMQQLLTAKTRFSEFSDDWKKSKLNDCGEVITGTTPSTKIIKYYANGIYPWVTPTDIADYKNIYNSKKSLTEAGVQKGRFIKKDSLLITCIASIGKNAILRIDGSCNQQINAITVNKKFNVDFLYYLIEFKKNILISYAGQGGMMVLNKNDFSNLIFLFPQLQEQQKIAQALTLANDEITKLQTESTLLKSQKKGLMQKLLTGKVRVKA